MNHIKTTSVIAAIVTAALALTAVVMAIPQQALAYGHHHHHNHNSNSIKVSQDTSQLNACSESICLNNGTNSVNIDR
jgi:hypothetical protein